MSLKKSTDIIRDLMLKMVVKSALSFEQESKDYYQYAASIIQNSEGKSLMEWLVKEEEQHILKLEEMMKLGIHLILENVNVAKVSAITERKKLAPADFDPNANPVTLIEHAMKREDESYSFYSELYEKARHEEVRKLFALLAHEEYGHKIKLEDLRAQFLG